MKSITFTNTGVNNDNDCWNRSIAHATKQSYKKVRKDFKAFIRKNGSLNEGGTRCYLTKRNFDYFTHTVSGNYLVKELIQFMDTKNNHLVIDMKYKAKNNMSHLVYVHNSKVYDNKNKDTLTAIVIGYYIKAVTKQ